MEEEEQQLCLDYSHPAEARWKPWVLGEVPVEHQKAAELHQPDAAARRQAHSKGRLSKEVSQLVGALAASDLAVRYPMSAALVVRWVLSRSSAWQLPATQHLVQARRFGHQPVSRVLLPHVVPMKVRHFVQLVSPVAGSRSFQ